MQTLNFIVIFYFQDREHFLKNLTTLCDSSILDSPYPLYLYFMGLHDIPTDMTSYTKMKIELSFTAFNMQCIPDINNFVENSQKVSFFYYFHKIMNSFKIKIFLCLLYLKLCYY